MSLKHTAMFKAQILALKQAGHKISDLNKRYKLGHSTISRWEQAIEREKQAIKAENIPKSESQMTEERIKDLEFELSQLREEHEIMKAAVSLLCKKKSEK
ncbi:MAG: hypothetical protein FWG98_14090 [Candidatus Cloacimonetes bacterium]|nr:hypothetical protein [Candidatus Cloacimonadota bacterium]